MHRVMLVLAMMSLTIGAIFAQEDSSRISEQSIDRYLGIPWGTELSEVKKRMALETVEFVPSDRLEDKGLIHQRALKKRHVLGVQWNPFFVFEQEKLIGGSLKWPYESFRNTAVETSTITSVLNYLVQKYGVPYSYEYEHEQQDPSEYKNAVNAYYTARAKLEWRDSTDNILLMSIDHTEMCLVYYSKRLYEILRVDDREDLSRKRSSIDFPNHHEMRNVVQRPKPLVAEVVLRDLFSVVYVRNSMRRTVRAA